MPPANSGTRSRRDADFRYFATAPKGVASLLIDELRALGATALKESVAGVHFAGGLAIAYRACLWSRTANRILCSLATDVPAGTSESLYQALREIPWHEHLGPSSALAVDFASQRSAATHTHYGALKVKDAIVDHFRDRSGARPSVDTQRPDVRVNVYVDRDVATVSIDLAGSSLHQRGYRTEGASAPLKENLAAALLLRAGWPAVAAAGGGFVDPLCGSGTLPIEAALMAGDRAPGLLREYYGFLGWKQHDVALWAELLREAQERARAGRERIPPIFGSDGDARAVGAARGNAARAGLGDVVRVTQGKLADAGPHGLAQGLLLTNPPYGERLGDRDSLDVLYRELGQVLRERFAGWEAGVFTGNPDLGKRMGLRAKRYYTLYNGAIECRLLCFSVTPEWHVTEGPPRVRSDVAEPVALSPGAQMFANRLRKNLRELSRWAQAEQAYCYRLYDADMPEYAFAVDIYEGEAGQRWVHVQEYAAPKSVDAAKAAQRREEALAAIPQALEIDARTVFFKTRERHKRGTQYEKLNESGEFFAAKEGSFVFFVNFTDYLDTGIFLDHRLTRRRLATLAKDAHFLNLFGYTGTANVYAAAGGARSTLQVDMSRTYTEWAQRNLERNGFRGPAYQFIQEDCLAWLRRAVRDRILQRRFGLIFIDPPTLSRSKRMTQLFDVQRDHGEIIRLAAQLLAPGGLIVFSTNLRSFKLDEGLAAQFVIDDVTASTLPRDYARNPRIHCCWELRLLR